MENESALNPTITVTEVTNQSGDGIGGSKTFFDIKNPSSYLLGTWLQGLKLIEENKVEYVQKLPEEDGSLSDIIYIEELNSYLLDHSNKIYVKQIDDQGPSVFMDFSTGACREGSSFRYSSLHKRLISIQNGNSISVINLEEKQVESSVTLDPEEFSLVDFRLFGENQDRVIALTRGGGVYLCQIDYGQKKAEVVAETKIELTRQKKEKGFAIAVSEDNGFAFVEIEGKNKRYQEVSSRAVVLEIAEQALTQKAAVDQFEEGRGRKLAVEGAGISGNHYLWVSVTQDKIRRGQVLVFDKETGELKDLENKQFNQIDSDPYKLYRLGGELYFVGFFGRIVKLSVAF